MTPTDSDQERAAPWCQDAWFVLTISGDGQGTSLHHGWEAICDALVAAHYFKPDDDQRAEVIARFTDWEIWESAGGYLWRWLSRYEDGAVSVERVTDGAALAEVRRGALEEAARSIDKFCPESAEHIRALAARDQGGADDN